ncbi:MAG: exonuclease SbcCD subunit D [Anaerovoracaceae bacterium]|jgi:exonuclease SbcD
MKLMHLSDLHLGKRLYEFSLLEDQRYILAEILDIVDRERPQAVLIAGDVYDRSSPSAEAVTLLDSFLSRLAERQLQIFLISGNHDSAEKLAFGARLMDASGVHFARVCDGRAEPLLLSDADGETAIYMLPFVRPAQVRRWYGGEAEIDSYTAALRTAIEHMEIDPERRSVLLAHQFVTGAARADSEEIYVGGTENVDADVFAPFDYVALGHLHSPQSIARETLRYCGTPLKYSFSEAGQQKSVTMVELKAKGEAAVRTVPLRPRHDLRCLRGSFADLCSREAAAQADEDRCAAAPPQEDYLQITLTDEEEIPDAAARLRVFYPNLMKLEYDNRRTRSRETADGAVQVEEKSPLTLLNELYEKQNGQPLDARQKQLAQELIRDVFGAAAAGKEKPCDPSD